MGILTDALSIAFGSLLGAGFRRIGSKNFQTLGIGIMIVSLVGFLENIFSIDGDNVVSKNLIIVLLAYFAGSKIGEKVQLDVKLSNIGITANKSFNAFIDSALFFGVGGLQISGPILLALNGDSSQLFIKSFVDLPFAIAFGATYGKIVSLASLPVVAVQIAIAVIAHRFSAFFSSDLTAQLCAIGYIILFFSGYNLMSDGKHKVSNINMLPGILIIMLIHVLSGIMEIL